MKYEIKVELGDGKKINMNPFTNVVAPKYIGPFQTTSASSQIMGLI